MVGVGVQRLGEDAVAPGLAVSEQHFAGCGGMRGEQLAQRWGGDMPSVVSAVEDAYDVAVAGDEEVRGGSGLAWSAETYGAGVVGSWAWAISWRPSAASRSVAR